MAKSNRLMLIGLKLEQEIFTARVIAGYAYGFWLGMSIGIRYILFAAGGEAGVFDAFILLTNQTLSVSLLLIGFFIIIADAPFIDMETYYILIRSGGDLWRLSMTGYIAIQLFIYQGIIILGSALPCVFAENITIGWSDTIQLLLNAAPKIAVTRYHLPVLDNWMLTSWSAAGAFFLSFFLVSCYCFFLGMVIFTGNLNTRLPLGNLIAIGIHFIGMLVMSDFVPLYRPSMLAHGILQFHVPGRDVLSLPSSCILFGVCIAGILVIMKKVSKNMDYNTAVSQKIW